MMNLSTYPIALFLLTQLTAFSQRPATLNLEGRILTGQCDHRNFSGFNIELDTVYTDLDSTTLFGQLPRIGTINFKNRVDIPTEFTLTERAGYAQIMFRFRTTYLTFDNLEIHGQKITFTIDGDPEVPVTEDDLKTIRLAKSLLSEEKYWNRKDDRVCEDDLANKSYSIYCALRIASLEVEDRYNHRNAVLQKLRHKIRDMFPGRKWNHRLMDFNNMEEVDFKVIRALLNEIEMEFLEALGEKD